MVKPKFELEIINKIETENQLRHCMNMNFKSQMSNSNSKCQQPCEIKNENHYGSSLSTLILKQIKNYKLKFYACLIAIIHQLCSINSLKF